MSDDKMNEAPPVVAARDPRTENIQVAKGTDQQMRSGQNMVKLCPKYDRKIPWRQLVYEFRSVVETFV